MDKDDKILLVLFVIGVVFFFIAFYVMLVIYAYFGVIPALGFAVGVALLLTIFCFTDAGYEALTKKED